MQLASKKYLNANASAITRSRAAIPQGRSQWLAPAVQHWSRLVSRKRRCSSRRPLTPAAEI